MQNCKSNAYKFTLILHMGMALHWRFGYRHALHSFVSLSCYQNVSDICVHRSTCARSRFPGRSGRSLTHSGRRPPCWTFWTGGTTSGRLKQPSEFLRTIGCDLTCTAHSYLIAHSIFTQPFLWNQKVTCWNICPKAKNDKHNTFNLPEVQQQHLEFAEWQSLKTSSILRDDLPLLSVRDNTV